MRIVFKNDQLQKHFAEHGYCLVPLMNADDIRELNSIYNANRVEDQPAMERSTSTKDVELSRRIKNLCTEVVAKRLEDYLINYKPLYSGFITKLPGKPNQMRLHQDPSFVDEHLFTALNVWSPLVDVNENNGALWIVPKSNKFFDGFRGQPARKFDYADISDAVMQKFGTMVPMKTGEALIYDTALFHYSLASTAAQPRIASSTVMLPAEATPIYYHYNKELNSLDIYEMGEDFMIRYFSEYLKTGVVKEKLLSRGPYTAPQKVSLEEFTEKFNTYNKG